ncbi:uncharacterized protein KY384_005759 [Bacidia gigantensis]|uniref:uncharacterized protein n=1 Tax=Bacidia gigantensis TaxID=2732470 RepID=UPI001D046C89|nr:uncharacterized protein KY384_005759 [Bacidia gigantensis]KAG8529124.1 hypothetical protein KY384_005759 [Bacidia gigantensis]
MKPSIRQTLLFLATCLATLPPLTHAAPAVSFDTASYSPSFIIKRDVVVLGGGASGTYAAIALRDRKKSVAVIEKQDYLGGHTNTYTDPASGKKIDYGVVLYEDIDIVKKFFARFDIPLTVANFSSQLTPYRVDFRTGKQVAGYTPADPTAGFGAYGAQLAKYAFLNEPGYDLPNPVPDDLLIPFGDFIKKYKIDSAVFTINEYAQGFGNLLEIPSLYVLRYFGTSTLAGFQAGFLTTARGNNGELYEKASKELGGDVFLSSTVIATLRTNNGVKLVIQTPQGLKLVIASKLIISAPPLVSNLAGFDLSTQERSLFQQWVTGAYYTSLVSDTGIPDIDSITNVGADTPYNLPPDAAVKSAIVATINRIKTASGIPGTTPSTPKFVAFNSHTPYELRVSSDAIKGGFYAQLNALQGAGGAKSTFYTGAAFARHGSGDVWAFTEGIVAGL